MRSLMVRLQPKRHNELSSVDLWPWWNLWWYVPQCFLHQLTNPLAWKSFYLFALEPTNSNSFVQVTTVRIFIDSFLFTLERKYQCLGQWTENNIIYTYAKRVDVPVYECFLGALASPEEIFIKEAGEHCRRIDPYRYAMQLNKTKACPQAPIRPDLAAPTSAHDAVSTSGLPLSPTYETTSPNGEIEYEYYEENHASISGSGNIMSSTESRKGIAPQLHKDGLAATKNHKAPSTNSEDPNYELLHPDVHPKLNAGTIVKSGSTNMTQSPNYSRKHCSDQILLLLALLLPLLKP